MDLNPWLFQKKPQKASTKHDLNHFPPIHSHLHCHFKDPPSQMMFFCGWRKDLVKSIRVFPKIKSSIFIGFSTINHPFWGTPIFGNTHLVKSNLKPTQLLPPYPPSTSKGSNIPFRVTMICFGCSSTGNDRINAATCGIYVQLCRKPRSYK